MSVTTPCADCGPWSVVLALPWPPPALWPNRLQHWSRLAKAKSKFRGLCRLETLRQVPAHRRQVPDGPLALDLEIHPPDGYRRRDVDNIVAALKSGFDGICDALEIDDSAIRARTDAIGDPMRGGLIYVRLRRLP